MTCLQATEKRVDAGEAVFDAAEASKWCPNCRFIFDSLWADSAISKMPIGEVHEKYACTVGKRE